MAHTLRRSKSKYGRTRRQRRKQKKMQGGGIFDDFVKKFKPSSPEEKCENARKDAEEACSSISQETPLPSSPQSELDSGFPESPSVTSESATIAEPEPLESLSEPVIASDSNTMPGSESGVVSPISTSAPSPVVQSNESALALEQPRLPSTMSEPELSVTPAALAAPNAEPTSALPNQKYNGLGGTKRKQKNKKQNRRKKMKSRKHKK